MEIFNNPLILSSIFSIITIVISYLIYNKEDTNSWNSIKCGIFSFLSVLISLFIYNPNIISMSKDVIKTTLPPF
jgi:membrane protein YdbS with pleckstrin-like domain